MPIHPHIKIHKLIEKIQPRPVELQKAMFHSVSVRKRLNKSFDLKRFIKIGSHSRGTAIRSFSDIDFLAVLAKNEAKWGGNIISSTTFLEKIRDDLNDRFTQTTVRRDMQAVVVSFGQGQHSMDIVPAIFYRFHKSRPVYWIPDGSDKWIETSPELHNNFILRARQRSGSKLIKLLQLLKWWKISREEPIPILSFHMDILFAESDVCIGIKPYTRCLYEAFQLLKERDCRGVRDPIEIAGTIYASNTDAQLEVVNQAVNYAFSHAQSAMQAEAWKDYEEANRQWNIVFNWNM